MNYPLISEYIEAIKSAEDNFKELSYLSPVLGDDGLPVMTSGNFAVVFKMKDEQMGKLYAIKCFTKEQEGRAEAYREITKELEDISSPYILSIRYLENELFVDTNQTEEEEFPILLMDWVEGIPLDKYIHENINNPYALEMLAFRFCELVSWLLEQPFSHGDLKPDNILIREDGTIVLVDYDGMFVPSMKGKEARELGSPNFRHPLHTKYIFDERIDDYSIALIALSLKVFSLNTELANSYCTNDYMLFKKEDFGRFNSCEAMSLVLDLIYDNEVQLLLGTFMIALANNNLSGVSPLLFSLNKSIHELAYGEYIYDKARNFCEEAKDKSQIDYNKAFKLFFESALLGNADAQCCLGCCYKNGYGTHVDYSEARTWYEKSSKNGCARALRHIGFCYQDGLGVKKDICEAIKWYDRAIDAGDISSMVTKGAIYYYGKEDTPINYTEAARLYAMAADKGDDDGMWRLALCYQKGKGVEKNLEKSFELFKKSAEKDNPEACYGLGQCYYLGYGVEKDYNEAFVLFQKAAGKGQRGSLWQLGRCYEYGHGVNQNLVKAYEWYKKSAEAGSSEGQWRLGRCYEKGIGVSKDISLAIFWYEKAKNQGHRKAREDYNLLMNNDLPF